MILNSMTSIPKKFHADDFYNWQDGASIRCVSDSVIY